MCAIEGTEACNDEFAIELSTGIGAETVRFVEVPLSNTKLLRGVDIDEWSTDKEAIGRRAVGEYVYISELPRFEGFVDKVGSNLR